ncbi:MAG: glycosyltransferase family 2 protein [Acutalibacteraceae bacterium]|nr:glycosyltransferase family 2 protein [Acutalibacteraceae bacterium]
MENQPLVSVIIPVYNVEEYLRECVDSVLNQTYGHFEIILVDDGSTDSSGKICDEYVEKDERIVAIHKKNEGPSKTRNTGLENANGKYIYFLDSDDYIENDALELLVNTAKSNDADLVFFDARSFSDDGAEVKQGYVIKGTYEIKSGYEILTNLHNNKEYHCSVVLLFIKRQLIIENKISFLESAYCSEDMLFTYKIFCSAQKAIQCTKTLYHRRYRPSSIVTSKKSQRHFRSCRDVYEEIRDYSEKIGKSCDYMATEYTVRCAFNALDTYKKISRKDQLICKSEYKTLKKNILSYSAFGDTALKMRCYGKIFWFIYKIFEKTVGRLKKGTK